VIGAFPTNNSYTSLDVVKRWNFIAQELEKYDISCSFSSDGDPRLLAGMKSLTDFGKSVHLDEVNVDVVCDINSKHKCIQDPIHLTNKLKNRLFDSANDIEIGGYPASINHVRILVETKGLKDQHKLNASDINSNDKTRDKMNAESTRKICTTEVIKLIEDNVIGSNGTVAYLQVMRAIYNAFIELDVNPLDRLYYGYFAISFMRIWRNNIPQTEKNNFITANVWTSLELNFTYLLDLVMNGKGHFTVIYNSQSCEELFRTLRSLSSFGLTEINFTVLECFEKINRVRKIQDISFDLKDIFKLRENQDKKSDKSHAKNVPIYEPCVAECKRVLEEAFKYAKAVCKKLKMKILEPCNPQHYLRKSAPTATSIQSPEINDYNLDINDMNILKIKNTFILDVESGKLFYLCILYMEPLINNL